MGPSNFEAASFPRQVTGLKQARALVLGPHHACAVRDSGDVWCWGDNESGQISGSLLSPLAAEPVALGAALGIKGVGVGATQTCAIDFQSHVFCRGTDASGERADAARQVPVAGPPEAQLAAGTPHLFDELGQVIPLDVWAAPRVDGDFGQNNAWAGRHGAAACKLKRSGSLWCKGFEKPYWRVETSLGESVVRAGIGDGFRCALSADGRVWCAGANDLGQLASGSNGPAAGGFVSGLGSVTELAVAEASVCALEANGSVSCWGAYAEGIESNLPARVMDCAHEPPLLPTPIPQQAEADARQRYDEAGRARGQALCECATPAGTDILECAQAEDFSVNGACLMALASDDSARWDCLADRLWQEASCYANQKCRASLEEQPMLEPCFPKQVCPAAKQPVVEAFCLQRHCDQTSGTGASKWQICDGTRDCPDGSDELNCTPYAGVFQCSDGTTTTVASLCNGTKDCPDSSDEDHCL